MNNLIDKKDFKGLVQFLKKYKYYYVKFHNNYNLAHIAILHNNDLLFNYIIENVPLLFLYADINGYNALHHAFEIGHYEKAHIIIKTVPNSLKYIDNLHRPPIFLIMNRITYFIDFFMKYHEHLNLNQLDNNGKNLLSYLIPMTEPDKINDYEKCIDVILQYKNIDLKNSRLSPPLFETIKIKNYRLMDKLIKYNKNIVNIYNYAFLTPIAYATQLKDHNVILKLLKYDVDTRYSGFDSEYNLMKIAFNNKDLKAMEIFSKDPHLLHFPINKYLDTITHLLLSDNNTKYEFLAEIIYKTNLNTQNIVGVTPLHILLFTGKWLNFNKYLSLKKLDLFIEDQSGSTPDDEFKKYLQLKKINNNHEIVHKYHDMIINSYLTQLENNSKKRYDLSDFDKKCYENIDECKKTLLDTIFKNKISYPIVLHEHENNNLNINLVSGIETNKGIFLPDTQRLIYFILTIMNKYNTLTVPFQYFTQTKYINDTIKFTNEIQVMLNDDYYPIYSSYMTSYMEILYEMSPSIILWKNIDINYIHRDFDNSFKKCLYHNSKRFIYIRLSIMVDPRFNHANVILFDKKTGILERFEPYGNLSIIDGMDDYHLDNFIEERISSIVKPYLDKHKLKLEYISPSSYNNGISFQTVSDEDSISLKKHGDPMGYCLAWSLWYLEMRLSNPDVHPLTLIDESLKLIINRQKNTVKLSTFIDFIRNYTTKIENEKNKLLLSIGFNQNSLYNIIGPEHDVVKKISSKFMSIVNLDNEI
jgi:hypothetical protein